MSLVSKNAITAMDLYGGGADELTNAAGLQLYGAGWMADPAQVNEINLRGGASAVVGPTASNSIGSVLGGIGGAIGGLFGIKPGGGGGGPIVPSGGSGMPGVIGPLIGGAIGGLGGPLGGAVGSGLGGLVSGLIGPTGATGSSSSGSSCGCHGQKQPYTLKAKGIGTGGCPCGYHRVIKRLGGIDYLKPDVCVKDHKKMNVLNPEALTRANRRVNGFVSKSAPILKKLGYHVSTTRKPTGRKKAKKRFGR